MPKVNKRAKTSRPYDPRPDIREMVENGTLPIGVPKWMIVDAMRNEPQPQPETQPESESESESEPEPQPQPKPT